MSRYCQIWALLQFECITLPCVLIISVFTGHCGSQRMWWESPLRSPMGRLKLIPPSWVISQVGDRLKSLVGWPPTTLDPSALRSRAACKMWNWCEMRSGHDILPNSLPLFTPRVYEGSDFMLIPLKGMWDLAAAGCMLGVMSAFWTGHRWLELLHKPLGGWKPAQSQPMNFPLMTDMVRECFAIGTVKSLPRQDFCVGCNGMERATPELIQGVAMGQCLLAEEMTNQKK